MQAIVGGNIQIPGIGPCKIEKIHKSGSAVVKDTNGLLWLVSEAEFAAREINLFSFVPDGPGLFPSLSDTGD